MTTRILLLVLLSNGAALLPAAPGPIRELFGGQAGTESARHAHVVMRDLGRDAIWFDYVSASVAVTPDDASEFDAVMFDPRRDGFAALKNSPGERMLSGDFSGPESTWAGALREEVLSAVTRSRRQEWEAFLARREPEKREQDPNVASVSIKKARRNWRLMPSFS